MNNVNLIGRLTNAVDFRYSQAQNPYCFFTIAVDRQEAMLQMMGRENIHLILLQKKYNL